MTGWSAAEVARASGTSIGQLRAWEGSGLLVPGVASDDGYRAYGPDDLVRLQRVLLLRTLGVPDDGIAAALEHTPDPAAALQRHLDVLEAMRERLGRQAAALRATLDGRAGDPATMFDGFDDPDPVPPDELADLGRAWARTWAAGEPVDGAAAQALAGRHRALSGPELTPGLADALDRHGLGTAAYARDALSVS
ncbi:MerR family transcriptional regulator [Actinomycetospora sp.]|jgi:DNA-binding transcriptional MerR regulator|uniref:MerR family transcriptional regulator n=1 Tax=Actinomycetospora sp. TaxID=1872135 RepID=UPI002F3E2405